MTQYKCRLWQLLVAACLFTVSCPSQAQDCIGSIDENTFDDGTCVNSYITATDCNGNTCYAAAHFCTDDTSFSLDYHQSGDCEEVSLHLEASVN